MNYVTHVIINVEEMQLEKGINAYRGETIALMSNGIWRQIHTTIWAGKRNKHEWYAEDLIMYVAPNHFDLDSVCSVVEYLAEK